MPKASKASTNLRRQTPYPVTSTTSIAPAPASIMSSQGATSLSHSRAVRHRSHTWNPEDDEKLMRARQQGLNWQPIATQYFPDKTSNACRKRHERLMEKRNSADNWDNAKIEAMAKAYLDVREQMWKLLAERLDDRWQDLEAKCMEKGLKTLHTVGRSATRRERQQLDGDQLHHDDGDNSFNDSALPLDPDHQSPISNQTEHPRRSYMSSLHNDQGQFSAGFGTITPPNGSTYSHSSTSSSIPITSPYQSMPHHSPYHQSQTLPSFSAAFGQPSVPVPHSAINRHSPHQHSTVTTH